MQAYSLLVISMQFSIILLLLPAAARVHATEDTFLIRTLSTGKIRGKRVDESNGTLIGYQYNGIPYAQVPLKDLRYRNPLPPKSWNNTLDTKHFKKSCSQTLLCLLCNSSIVAVLSVYFVEQSSADVIGYIDENIVVVSTSYRIASFGFLNVNPLKDTVQDKNVGLYDIIESLLWIKREIVNFGGNALNVTVISSRNGAVLADLLSLSPLSEGLFSRLVLISGSAAFRALSNASDCFASRQLSVQAKCAENYTKFAEVDASNIVLECLRSRDARYIETFEASFAERGLRLGHPSAGPTQKLFPTSFRNLILMRRPIAVLLIVSKIERLRDESLLIRGKPDMKRLGLICERFAGLSDEFRERCLHIYSSVRIVDIYNDYRIHSASVETAETVNAANGSSFLFESNANFAIDGVFRNRSSLKTSILQEAVTSFILTAVPMLQGHSVDEFHSTTLTYYEISEDFYSKKSSFRREQCEFWNNVKRTFPMEDRVSCNGDSDAIMEQIFLSNTLNKTEPSPYRGTKESPRAQNRKCSLFLKPTL
uniref:Carboxylesterase type B domain-containing protein n=1 Tax=Ascaris lumbricoides TaxID=6252 RepID=A0A9J2P6T9_ASCLU